VSFSARGSGRSQAPSAGRVTALAEELLRRAGADPGLPHQTRHYLYLPGVARAQRAAWDLHKPDREIAIDTSARKGYWLVVVTQRTLITAEVLAGLRAEMEAVIEPLGGEYDAWQLDLSGD
jgi:hypothetical protein